MAATTGGAVKAYIEGLGLSLTAYRDAAPSKPDPTDPEGKRRIPLAPFPFVTVDEAVSLTANSDGDLSDPAGTLTVRELIQVNLWQRWRDANGRPAESYTLPAVLLKKLRGARLGPVGSSVVYGVTGVSMLRLLEEERNVVHHAYTCTVHRAA